MALPPARCDQRHLQNNRAISAPRRGEADGSHVRKRSPWFPWQTPPRRTQCGVGADDGLVTDASCARDHPFIAPLRPPSQGTRFRTGGVSRFLCLLSLRPAKKVGAAPHRGNANRPLTPQEKANKPTPQTPQPPPPPRRKKFHPAPSQFVLYFSADS
jgi:hypothetical protein